MKREHERLEGTIVIVAAYSGSGDPVYQRKLHGYHAKDGLQMALHNTLHDFRSFHCQIVQGHERKGM